LLADDDAGDLFTESRHPSAGGVDGVRHRGGVKRWGGSKTARSGSPLITDLTASSGP